MFDPSALEPPLILPIVNFKRIDVPSDIPVPNLVGNAVENAKAQLLSIGLEADSNWIPVEQGSGQALNTVIAQDPQAGMKVPPKTRVRLTANYVPSKRFLWATDLKAARLTDFIRRGG